jgi:hypothetical protein
MSGYLEARKTCFSAFAFVGNARLRGDGSIEEGKRKFDYL